MSPDFKAEEEELDRWFDEEKDKASNDYFKKVDQFRPKDGDDEDKKDKGKYNKELSKQYSSSFLQSSEKIRKEYDKRFDAYQRKKKTYNLLVKTKDILLFIPKKTWKVIVFISVRFYKYFFRPVFIVPVVWIFKSGRKGYGDMRYHSKEYYTFHTRHYVDPFLDPVRRPYKLFSRRVHKTEDRLKEKRKKLIADIIKKIKELIDKTIKIGKKIWEFITKYFKKISDFITKWVKKIKEFYGKWIYPVLKPLFWILKKLGSIFAKKDDGGDDE